MKNVINEKYAISPFLVFFLMFASMVELGILKYQHELIKHAGYNAWISVLISGISIHLILWMIYKTLSSNEECLDAITINHKCFGIFFGNILNLAIVLYFFFGAFITFRGYLAIIQVWLFPVMNILPISIIIVLLIYYTVSGGFRSVTGISFWGVLTSFIFVIPLNFLVFQYLHPQNLLPLFNHSLMDIMRSSKSMVFQYLGIEVLLIIYPFIKTPAKSQKWAQLAVFTVTFIYLGMIIIALMYYSEGQLRQIKWPTLHIIMFLQIPLFQRLEYLVISVLFIKILANIALGLWVACRGAKNALHIKQPVSLIVFLSGFLILECFIKDQDSIRRITEYYSTVGFYFIYVYIPIIFLITQIRKKIALMKMSGEMS